MLLVHLLVVPALGAERPEVYECPEVDYLEHDTDGHAIEVVSDEASRVGVVALVSFGVCREAALGLGAYGGIVAAVGRVMAEALDWVREGR